MKKDRKFVVYRTGYPNETPPLEYIEQDKWDNYLLGTPETRCVEISRGHTITEAINLTELANEQRRLEREDG